MAKTTEVTIKSRGFTYDKEVEDPAGGKTVVRAYASQGDTIEVNDKDLAVGKKYGDFLSGDEEAAQEALGGRSVTELSDDELVEWIEGESPTVKEVVAAAGDDPESAQRLLDAEDAASGRDPRQGVVDGLNKIIEQE